MQYTIDFKFIKCLFRMDDPLRTLSLRTVEPILYPLHRAFLMAMSALGVGILAMPVIAESWSARNYLEKQQVAAGPTLNADIAFLISALRQRRPRYDMAAGNEGVNSKKAFARRPNPGRRSGY